MKRVQRKRTRGFRLPPNTICVDRTNKLLGNPFNWQDYLKDFSGNAVAAKRAAVVMLQTAIEFPERFPGKKIPTKQQICDALRGKDHVACFCGLDEPCHGDLYIRIATEENQT